MKLNQDTKTLRHEGKADVYSALSQSQPGVVHYVFVGEDKSIVCTCTGFQMNKKCWHATIVPLRKVELTKEIRYNMK